MGEFYFYTFFGTTFQVYHQYEDIFINTLFINDQKTILALTLSLSRDLLFFLSLAIFFLSLCLRFTGDPPSLSRSFFLRIFTLFTRITLSCGSSLCFRDVLVGLDCKSSLREYICVVKGADRSSFALIGFENWRIEVLLASDLRTSEFLVSADVLQGLLTVVSLHFP